MKGIVDATITIDGLNELLSGFGGRRQQPARDAEGQELPRDQQPTLGNILLSLVAKMKPNAEPRDVVLQKRVGDRLYEAIEGDGTYTAGTAALGILREATRQNASQYGTLILGQVWEAIGTGDDRAEAEV